MRSGECRDTVYTITPMQNIPGCENHPDPIFMQYGDSIDIPFTNPLNGTDRKVTVALDEVAPIIQCGFRPDITSINEVSVDGKTLYHYMLKTDGDGGKLADAQLTYNVTVS